MSVFDPTKKLAPPKASIPALPFTITREGSIINVRIDAAVLNNCANPRTMTQHMFERIADHVQEAVNYAKVS